MRQLIFRELSEHQHTASKVRSSVRDVIIEAAAHVGRPTMFSMLIIIIAHVPIFTLQRQEGRIFAPMAYTIVSALLGSLSGEGPVDRPRMRAVPISLAVNST